MAAVDDLKQLVFAAVDATGSDGGQMSFGDPDGDSVEFGGEEKQPGQGLGEDADGNDKPMQSLLTGIANYVAQQIGGVPTPGFELRVGDIILTTTAPPAGWQLADGTNGTPTLADPVPGVSYIIRMT